MCATKFNLHDVPKDIFQSFGERNSTAHKLRCTDDQSFGNADAQNDIVWLLIDKPPKGDVGDLRLAQRVRILRLQDGLWKRCVVLLPELKLQIQHICLPSNGLHRVSDEVCCQIQADLVVVNIKSV